MKTLVKYLLPVICFAVFFCKTDISFAGEQAAKSDSVLEATVDCSSISESEHDICIPRPTTFEAPQHLRSVQRRCDAGQKYSTCIFIKGGKAVSAASYIDCQNNSKQIFSNLPVPAVRLLKLGRLII